MGWKKSDVDFKAAANTHYRNYLLRLKTQLTILADLHAEKKPIAQLKENFLDVRKAYKKLSVFTDFLNPYETKLWNGPNQIFTEDDNPGKLINPHGFQVLENELWTPTESINTDSVITSEINFLLSVVDRLDHEIDGAEKFTPTAVFQSVSSALVRLITLGLTSFDSPVAQLTLPESAAVLQAISETLNLFLTNKTKLPAALKSIQAFADSAQFNLNAAINFNTLNRPILLQKYLIRLQVSLQSFGSANQLMGTSIKTPLNPNARHIFEANTFDINFFSPAARYGPTPDRVKLGKMLFSNPLLSGDGKRSCASCHKPEKAFTDGLQKSLAVDGKNTLMRNTPTLLYAALQSKQFYDSRSATLEFQANSVVHNGAEMNGQLSTAVALLKNDSTVLAAFKKAYPTDAANVSSYLIMNALASYIRNLKPFNSPFDYYMQGKTEALSPNAKAGFNLFLGKGKCGTCHFMPLFNGLVPPAFSESESEVIGVPANQKRPTTLDADSGKFYYTASTVHLFAFKTPTLRNIALTAPYMHNGIYKSLAEVIDFYNNGGGKGLGITLKNQTLPAEKLQLTKKEKQQLLAFLKALTDSSVDVP